MVKKSFKNAIGTISSNLNYPVIINSYGRSGSTMLTQSLFNSIIKSQNRYILNVLERTVVQSAWNLDDSRIQSGVIYKTHDYPPQIDINENIRVIYTYSDPVDVVLSLIRLFHVRGETWMRKHYQHLKVPLSNFWNIINEDQLQLEKHFTCWLNEKRFPVAFIQYERLWEHSQELSDFLNIQLELPPYKERKARDQDDIELISKLETTYSSLRNKINNLDSYFINNLND